MTLAYRSAVVLRLSEIRRRFAQDLVGVPEFEVLALELLQSLTLFWRQAERQASVTLGLLSTAVEKSGILAL